jgi:flagellar hook-associated protein 3 FlgL
MKKNLSNIEDVDLAKVMMDLQVQQVAYQAALSATARAIQPSLSDFLR